MFLILILYSSQIPYVQFPSRLLADKMGPFMYPKYYARADLFLYFHFKGSSFFVESLSFGFCLVNFERDACLAVDHSLVYSYPKMFLLFSCLILTA